MSTEVIYGIIAAVASIVAYIVHLRGKNDSLYQENANLKADTMFKDDINAFLQARKEYINREEDFRTKFDPKFGKPGSGSGKKDN